MAKSHRHYTPTETDDVQDEAFLKPLNEGSRQNMAGFLDDLLALSDATVAEDDPETLAAILFGMNVPDNAATDD